MSTLKIEICFILSIIKQTMYQANIEKQTNYLKEKDALLKENARLHNILLNGGGAIWRFRNYEKPNPTVIVTSITGKRIHIPVSNSSTVEDVKKKVEEIARIPYFSQRLIFAGHQLSNHRMLIHYNITNQSIIHLVIDMRNRKRWTIVGLTKDQKREIAMDNFEYDEIIKKVIQQNTYAAKYL